MELLKTHLPKLEKIEGVARKEFIEKSLNAEKEFEAKNDANAFFFQKSLFVPLKWWGEEGERIIGKLDRLELMESTLFHIWNGTA